MRLGSLLGGIFLGAFLIGSGCQEKVKNTYDHRIAISENLFVNKSDEVYIAKVDRKQGEKDLYGLVETAEFEESLIYAEFENGEKVWMENGSGERFGGVKPDKYALENLVGLESRIRRVSFYHFHPIDKGDHGDSQTPTDGDIAMCVNLMKFLAKDYSFLVDRMDCRVVVSTGTYTLKIDSDILYDGKAAVELNRLISKMNVTVYRFTIDRSKEFDYSMANKENFVKENKKFANKFSEGVLEIKFRSRM